MPPHFHACLGDKGKNVLYNCPPLTACRSKSFTRVCHPFPLLRSASKTLASRRMLSTFFCGFHNLRFTKWQGCVVVAVVVSVVPCGQGYKPRSCCKTVGESGERRASKVCVRNISQSFALLTSFHFFE